jgi:monoamine oxidase
MSRTPLLTTLRKAAALAQLCEENRISTAEGMERVAEMQWSRRQFLRTMAGAIVGTAVGTALPPRPVWGKTKPRIVIVGAGTAGLTCAYRLQQAGLPPQIIEAGKRVGGRMYSLRDVFPDGQLVELGGEFIDTGHTALRRLAKELGLSLVDLIAAENGRTPIIFFQNRHVAMTEIVDAFRPLMPRIRKDTALLQGGIPTYRQPRRAQALDQLSIAEWLDSRSVSGALRFLLETAYVGEFGLEADQQTALNLLLMIGAKPESFELLGESDERFHIAEGNDSVPTRLAERLKQPVTLETRLEALRRHANGTYTLTVNQAGTVRDLEADKTVLAIPFSVLRHVDLSGVELPEVKRRAIATLGYGTHTKLMTGFTRRVWYDSNSNGGSIADLPYQSSWETSRGQSGTSGILTNFAGGKRGVALGESTPEEKAAEFVEQLDRVFPGVREAHGKLAVRFRWATARSFLGSYACYRPGQYTTIAGAEGEAVGGLHFAGEHTSLTFQGFMNGAVESGEKVVREILGARRLGHRVDENENDSQSHFF